MSEVSFKMELINSLLDKGLPVNPTKTYKEPKRWKCDKCRDTGMIVFTEDGKEYAKECECRKGYV